MTRLLLQLAETVHITYPGPQGTDIKAGLTIIFGALGAISVIVIIIAGIRLMIFGNRPEEVGRLRNTIVYAAIGLAVALSAMGIIQFVTSWL